MISIGNHDIGNKSIKIEEYVVKITKKKKK
jgi:hypothetical protein